MNQAERVDQFDRGPGCNRPLPGATDRLATPPSQYGPQSFASTQQGVADRVQ